MMMRVGRRSASQPDLPSILVASLKIGDGDVGVRRRIRRSRTSRVLHFHALDVEFLAGEPFKLAASRRRSARKHRLSMTSPPQSRQRARPGTSIMSSAAPSSALPLRDDIEAETDRIRHDGRELADFERHARDPASLGLLGDDGDDRLRDPISCMDASTYARQLLADQHVDDALAAEMSLHHHAAGGACA